MGTVALPAPKQNIVELPIGSVINLDGDDIGSGSLQLLNETNPLVVDQTWSITSTPTGQIGPYLTTRKFVVKANTGTISYIITAAPGELSAFKENAAVNGVGAGAGGGIVSVTATSPLTKTGTSTAPVLGMPAATTASPGYMTAAQVASLTAVATVLVPAAITASRDLVAADNGNTLYNNTANNYTLTIPAGLPLGFGVAVVQKSTGAVTVAAGASTVLTSADAFTKTGGANKVISVINSGLSNDYILSGQGAA